MRKILLGLTSLLCLVTLDRAYADRIKRPKTSGFVLDNQTGTVAASYGLRQLTKIYTSAAVNVRRASDNTVQDIGFTSAGDIDTTGFNTFCASTQCFVVKWYDQSGNHNDAVQTTAANQPQIATDVNLSGRISIFYNDNTLECLVTPATTSIASMFSIQGYFSSVSYYVNVSTELARLWDKTGIAFLKTASTGNSYQFLQPASSSGSWTPSVALTLQPYIIDLSYSSANITNIPNIRYNSTLQSTTNVQPTGAIGNDSAQSLGIGCTSLALARSWPGELAEMIFWKTNIPTTLQQQQIRNNQKAYWNTP